MQTHNNLKNYIIKIFVTTGAVLLVMYLSKTWFITPHPAGVNNGQQPDVNAAEVARKESKAKVISWQDARKYYGDSVSMEGTIAATHNTGKICLLNFDSDYRKSTTIVIFASDFKKFPDNPENYYYGKKVRVYGRVKEYKGRPEVIVNERSQIEVLQ